MQLLSHASHEKKVYYLPPQPQTVAHPWGCRLKWVNNDWVANLMPGFVNGIDPVCFFRGALNGLGSWDASQNKPFLDNSKGKTGDFYTVAVAGAQDLGLGSIVFGVGDEVVFTGKYWIKNSHQVPLLDFPDIPLTAFESVSKISPFFVNLGAVPPPDLGSLNTSGAAAGNITYQLTAPVAGSGCCEGEPGKLLSRCQIWITQARPTFSVAIDTPANLVTGELADYTVTYNSASVRALGSRVRLFTGTSMPSPKKATLEERLAGAYGDDGTDSHLIATIYFLSLPQDSDFFSPTVDDTWIPFVQHSCFWNLGYQVNNNPPANLKQNPLDPSLAFFLGRYVTPAAVYGTTQSLEQMIMAAVMNENDNAGTFYTI